MSISREGLLADWTANQTSIRSKLIFADPPASSSTFITSSPAFPTPKKLRDLRDEYDTPLPRLERAGGIVVEGLRTIGGVDISFLPSLSSTVENDQLQEGVATVVVLAFPSLKLLHKKSRRIQLSQPYISSFLAFREAPPLLELFDGLRKDLELKKRTEDFPQVLFVDGNGRLHERECGLACILGLELGIPTIGISKKPYIFPHLPSSPPHWRSSPKTITTTLKPLLRERGAWIGLFHPPPPPAPTSSDLPIPSTKPSYLGAALIPSPTSLTPVFVSAGHLISLETSIRLTIVCSRTKTPEAVRMADLVGREQVRRWEKERDEETERVEKKKEEEEVEATRV